MKTLIVYTSQTGFTRKYSRGVYEGLNKKLNSELSELLTIKEAKRKKTSYFERFDAIIYGGWSMAGKVVKSKWFLKKAPKWNSKKLVMFCVGASPTDNPDLEGYLNNVLSVEEKKYIKLFYCPGGLNYNKMKFRHKILMKMFTAMLKKDKDASKREMGEIISHSYDISDKKYIEPIIEYIVSN